MTETGKDQFEREAKIIWNGTELHGRNRGEDYLSAPTKNECPSLSLVVSSCARRFISN